MTSVQETLRSLDPATGEVVGEYPVATAEDVRAAVDRAREAARWWSGLGWSGRRSWLRRWKRALAQGAGELAGLMSAETGKPLDDALLEIMLAVEHLDWAAGHAERVLGPRRVPAGLLAAHQAATLEYQPMGVVGVIGPWNYPVYTPMGSISYALAAGNAVVFKPSEYTPGTGRWLADRWAELRPEEPPLQVVIGDGATGASLCVSGVDKVAFTGSGATARNVLASCAESLTPVVAECGGKDALIVAADADLDAAAQAAVFGAFGNAGQTCAGVERAYVDESVFGEFVRRVEERAGRVQPGSSYGPITMPGQLDVIGRHIGDALDRGGKAVVGGREPVRAPFVGPVVVTGVPEDSAAVTEETFGPTLVINRARDLDHAVDLANESRYGLAASIFSRDRRTAETAARRLRCGGVSINSVLGFAAVPSLPFGGVGESGFGRIHGADGLREFARAKSVTRQRFRPLLDLMSFDRKPAHVALARTLLRLRHGR
ncbi:aldehyde dehydrogenase family protein [Amycolatopsis thermalba]|uniref:aldehyde dehydrogenase family protein n=1 Tax=Amycolatopsis thermalba TaxID=944492 RepID=UPI000E2286E1|nr:aldehyde dehydrogenase family protein [Amycolatopsis thermalba]